MKRVLVVMVLLGLLFVCGCDALRFGVTEAQKENAWVHSQVCRAAAECAVEEAVSAELRGLTALAEQQSGVFVADYGVPQEVPAMGDVDAMLAQGEMIASAAQADSERRPDVWMLADGAMELGVAVAGLIGGVYGLRIVSFLKQAREKAKALKEIVKGNELFKQLYPEQAERFKESQQKQSASTKQLVAVVKSGV